MDARLAKIVVISLTLLVLFFLPSPAQAGTCTWNATGNWSDAGKWTGCGGIVPDSDDSVVINGGTLTLDIPVTVAGFTMTAGTFTGVQEINITQSFEWSGGGMTGAGVTNILASAASVLFSDNSNLTLTDRTLNNYADAIWITPHQLTFSSTASGIATFNNKAGATFTINLEGANLFFTYSGSGVFNNEAGATFTKDIAGDTAVNISSFNNAGLVDLNYPGVFSLSTGSSTESGAFQVDHASAILRFSSGTYNYNSATSSIAGIGQVEFSYGTANISNGTYDVTGSTKVSNGTVNFTTSSTVNHMGALTISGGTLNLSSGGDIIVPSLVESSGYLDGSDNLTAAAITWSDGDMLGYGSTNVSPGGTLTITGPNDMMLETRTFNNSGIATWEKTGILTLNGNATFNNKAGASLTITQVNVSYIFYSQNGNNRFVNESGANFIKQAAGDGDVILDVDTFENSGTFTLLFPGALTLQTSTSTNTGTLNVQNSSATLSFSSGTFTSTSNITGGGTVDFAAGNTSTITGSYNITGGITVSGGTVNFESPITSLGAVSISSGTLNLSTLSATPILVPSLSLTSGNLDGVDKITATSVFWSGGTMKGFGTTNVAAGGTLTITGTSTITLTSRTFNNFGAGTWTKTGYLMFSGDAIFNNKPDATLTFTGVGANIFLKSGTNNKFINESGATFQKDTSLDTNASVDVFDNAGIVLLSKPGVLSLTLTASTGSGAYQVNDPDAVLRFSAGTYTIDPSSGFTGTGTMEFKGGTATLSGVYNMAGATTVSGGTALFTSSATVTGMGAITITSGKLDLSSGEAITVPSLTQSGGTLDGSDNVTANAVSWSAGTMKGVGTTNVPAGGTLTFASSGSPILDTRTFNNAGAATWNKTTYLSLYANTTFNNLATGTFTVINNGDYIFSRSGGSAGANTILNNAGTLNLRTGKIYVYQFIQTATGTTNFVIGGPTYGTDFCQFITTNANLNGTATITIASGYVPVQNLPYTLMTYGGKTGAFSAVLFPPTIIPGTAWTSSYFSTSWVVKIGWSTFLPTIKRAP